jgi:hypothetical protein
MLTCTVIPAFPIARNGRPVLPLSLPEICPISAPMVMPMNRQANHRCACRGALARLSLVLVLAGSSLAVALDAKSALDAGQAHRTVVAAAEATQTSSEAQLRRRHVARPSFDASRTAAFAASRHPQMHATADIH